MMIMMIMMIMIDCLMTTMTTTKTTFWERIAFLSRTQKMWWRPSHCFSTDDAPQLQFAIIGSIVLWAENKCNLCGA